MVAMKSRIKITKHPYISSLDRPVAKKVEKSSFQTDPRGPRIVAQTMDIRE